VYHLSNVAPNIRNYLSWLIETHSWAILIAFAVPVLVPGTPQQKTLMWMFVAVFVVVFALYLPYMQFEGWPYARFLLPGSLLLLILLPAGFERLARIAVGRPSHWIAMAAVVFLVAHNAQEARRRGVTTSRRDVGRARRIAEFVNANAPSDAVVMAISHSGSIRFYTGRTTIRYDFLEPDGLDRAVAFLETSGHPVFIAVDGWEEPQFKKRFAGQSLGALDWRPRVEIAGGIPVRLYATADR
jgi:hypothetical protein